MNKKQTQVLDIKAGKGFSMGQSNEHLRVASMGAYIAKLSNAFDPTREHLDFEVGRGGVILPLDKRKSIPKRIKENLKKRGIKDPNYGKKEPTYRTVANIIIGGSRDMMRKLAFGNQYVDFEHGADNSNITRNKDIEKWAVDMYNFIGKKYGEENIAAFIVHLDETNPHIHCTLLPVNNNKISWRKVFVGEENSKAAYQRNCIQLHNELAEVNKKYGLERGEPISETGAKHRTTEQWHAQRRIELAKEVEHKENEVRHASARLKALSTMIANLEATRVALMAEIKQLENDRDSGKISTVEAERRLKELNDRIRQNQEMILDKTAKLKIAEEQLQKVQNQTKEFEAKQELFQKELSKESPIVSKKIMNEMKTVGWDMALVDTKSKSEKYSEIRENCTEEQRNFLDNTIGELFDGSFLQDISDKGVEIIQVSACLYLGYLDKATSVAQSCGGGGGSPGSGWGKKDDEDDLAFKRRCFLMGMNMVRPSKKRNLKR